MFSTVIKLSDVDTPALVLDEARVLRNVDRLSSRIAKLGVTLRPHLKSVKSEELAKLMLSDSLGPATVSTLAECSVFAQMGVKDIVYAVGITPQKLSRIAAIRSMGCDLVVILDSLEQAQVLVATVKKLDVKLPALVEIDCDGHRAGVSPHDPALKEIGKILDAEDCLRGVLTHAGESYEMVGKDAHRVAAEAERQAAVFAAESLRDQGFSCPVVSIGSTPTAHALDSVEGITEVRAGVFAFFDLFQNGIEVCTTDDIALSVLTTVCGHNREKDWIIVDAGWMAMSRDRSTASQKHDQGYGLVCNIEGKLISDLVMIKANQEHGIIACRPGSGTRLPNLKIGTQLRILPNHACATAAQHSKYHVIPAQPGLAVKQWSRFRGW